MNLSYILLNFLFPQFCLICQQRIDPSYKTLCRRCIQSLSFLSPADRCPRCFHVTPTCYCQSFSTIDALAACCEDSHTINMLLTHHKSQSLDMIGLLLWHWSQLNWPTPDIIIPTPGDWLSRDTDYWPLRKRIAASIAQQLGAKYLPILTIDRSKFSHYYRSLEDQPSYLKEIIGIKKPEAIRKKNILLLHDRYTSGTSLRLSSAILKEYHAKKVMAYSIVADASSSLVS